MLNSFQHPTLQDTTMKQGYVYIMTNKNKTTTYIGVTSNLKKRMLQHKAGCGSVFTKRYNLHNLIYFESIDGMQKAIDREKQLKRWHKEWKWNLAKEGNPELMDLAEGWFTEEEIEEYGRRNRGGLG